MTDGDIKPITILPGAYLHYFGRLTTKNRFHYSFTDKMNIITLVRIWGAAIDDVLKDISF